MNNFLNDLKQENNFAYTENGAVSHRSTLNAVYDCFAFGGAYRSRSDENCIVLFKKAYDENPTYALKCLFYLRDARGGQGERRFFRTCMHWLAQYDTEAVRRNLKYFPEYGRYDDWFALFETPVENDVLKAIKKQLILDMQSYDKGGKEGISLLAKWMPSENASSKETIARAYKIRKYLNMTAKDYRKMLSALRKRINILERLMSENRWDEIEFDKIPSKAGLKYRNAFARHDMERQKSGARTYEDFIKDNSTEVNAGTLYPYEVVRKAIDLMEPYDYWSSEGKIAMDNTERLAINKYWDNLTDYFKDATFNGLAVVDTSGSMTWNDSLPISVATSLGLYCAERCNGPFAGHYVSFSSRPQLIRVEGVDFCDKVYRICETDLCENTDLEATFDMLLETTIRHNCKQEDLPQNLIIISDQEFDEARRTYYRNVVQTSQETLMESIATKWRAHGYEVPKLVFWNVNARHDLIPMKTQNGITFVSGCSPTIFQQIMTGKTSFDLMYEVLNGERYSVIE